MRNLKRALSLALASVMLLGMMVVGSSAAFADADKIVNDEAVGIAAGLGLFAGTTEGNFDPEGTVTRAQMAAVIAKMYYGSDLNADTYKGGNQFTDTASFEGGWAEGYINLGVEKGWFKGYGDGTFRPGQEVTTAEAMTMLINLLGIDAGEGTWPMTVMAAAEEAELFDDKVELKPQPATNAAMTRDQLSVVVVNALWYSAEGVLGYKVNNREFKEFADAVSYVQQYNTDNKDAITAGTIVPLTADGITEIKNDTLAKDIFEITEVNGYITANQATGAEATTLHTGLQVDLETGLDMLGHYVAVYYAERFVNEKNPGKAYAIVDLADYYTVTEPINNDKKDFVAAFGTGTINRATVTTFDSAANIGPAAFTLIDMTGAANTAYTASAGTYAFDKENGELITYMAPIATAVGVVNRISTVAGKESIRIDNRVYQNNADTDEIVAYDGIAEDDVVIVKNYKGTMTYVEKPEVVTGKVTKTVPATATKPAYTYIDGKEYENRASGTFTAFNGLSFTSYTPGANDTYDFYIYNGKLIGANLASSASNLDEAIFVVDTYVSSENSAYGVLTNSYYAQGITAAGEEVNILIGIGGVDNADDDGQGNNSIPAYDDTTFPYVGRFVTFEKSQDKEQAKKDIMAATPATDEATFDTAADGTYAFFADTLATPFNFSKDTKSLTLAVSNEKAYMTADTKFVVVDDTTYQDKLEIAVYTGVMTKNLSGADTVNVAVTQDADGNYLVAMVVVETSNTVLNAEDFIYIVDANYSAVGVNKYEYAAYLTATNELTTIIADDDTYTTGFYGGYTFDEEEGVYTLGTANTDSKVVWNEVVTGVFGNSISTGVLTAGVINPGTITDYALADDVVVMDIRDEDTLDKAEVAEIEALKDIQSALKGDYRVFVNALVEQDGADWVVTHIFVYSVMVEDLDPASPTFGIWSEC